MFVMDSGLLHQLRDHPKRLVYVVNEETFADDMDRVMSALCVLHPPQPAQNNAADFPRHNDTQLSVMGEASLRIGADQASEKHINDIIKR